MRPLLNLDHDGHFDAQFVPKSQRRALAKMSAMVGVPQVEAGRGENGQYWLCRRNHGW